MNKMNHNFNLINNVSISILFTSGVNVLGLIASAMMLPMNKLECLSLVCDFYLVLHLQVSSNPKVGSRANL